MQKTFLIAVVLLMAIMAQPAAAATTDNSIKGFIDKVEGKQCTPVAVPKKKDPATGKMINGKSCKEVCDERFPACSEKSPQYDPKKPCIVIEARHTDCSCCR